MEITREQHIAFWQHVVQCLADDGLPAQALNEVPESLAGTDFEEIMHKLAEAVEGGIALHEALAQHPSAFSRSIALITRAGEEGLGLDASSQRILEGIQTNSFILPGALVIDGNQQVYFWRTFGAMLAAGVPILEGLAALSEEAVTEPLRNAAEAIRRGIMEGRSIAESMREMPDLFDNGICDAVAAAEQEGKVEPFLEIAEALAAGKDVAPPEVLKPMGDLPPARRFVNTMILGGIEKRASDIHVEPTEDGSGRFRFRIDGVLHDAEPSTDATWDSGEPLSLRLDQAPFDATEWPSGARYQQVVNRIKVMAAMDTAEKKLPQDGRIEVKINGRLIDLRVCTLPTYHGEKVVMRILVREQARIDLEQIGLLEDDMEKIRRLVHLPHGVILCSGPTGSGKTTLMYSMLMQYDRDRCSVVTVEDPIEYFFEGISQSQIQPQIGLTFPSVVRSMLRQDPDIVMIGEIRNLETAQLAAICGMTGHVVLTQLHANTAPGGIKRLLDMGIEPFILNASLEASISQRLVRTLCGECKEPISVPTHSVPPEAVEWLEQHEGATFHGPKGCETCMGTGYRGRTAIHEVLILDDGVRNAVAAGGELAAIKEAALAAGMRPMLQCGIEKAARGITSIQEVVRVACPWPR